MKTPQDAGPAFPIELRVAYETAGLSIRDYFAAAALQGLLAQGPDHNPHSVWAWDAYKYADAMLTERTKAKYEQS